MWYQIVTEHVIAVAPSLGVSMYADVNRNPVPPSTSAYVPEARPDVWSVFGQDGFSDEADSKFHLNLYRRQKKYSPYKNLLGHITAPKLYYSVHTCQIHCWWGHTCRYSQSHMTRTWAHRRCQDSQTQSHRPETSWCNRTTYTGNYPHHKGAL